MTAPDGKLASGQLLFIDADDAGQVRVSIYGSPPQLDEDGSEMPDAFLLLSPVEATEIAGRITDAAEEASDTPANDPLADAADRVAELLRRAEAAEAAGRDTTLLQGEAFDIATKALQAGDPPWRARSPRLGGET
jgi:hypothetical protein